MSATRGTSHLAARTFLTISPSAAAALLLGAVMRTISQPASAKASVCATVASTFCVFVVVIDWMRMGLSPPTPILPMLIARVFQRFA